MAAMAGKHIFKTFKPRQTYIIPDQSLLQWYPGHMKKGLDDIQSSLHGIDAILEVHDARIPLTGRNIQLHGLTKVRPHTLLLNKSDLADLSQQELICDKLQRSGVNNILFTNCNGKHFEGFIKKKIIPNMLHEIQSKPRYSGESMHYNIMVIGVPNVGKSTLLNKLRQTYTHMKKSAQVGAMPGVTRAVMNKVKICFDPPMFVVDTPGIMNPRIPDTNTGMKLALCDCLPNHLVGQEYIADYLLYWLNKTHNFSYVDLYGLSEPTNDVMQFLAKVGLMNQYVVKTKETDSAGKPKFRIDFTRAAASAIGDFRKGMKLALCDCLPNHLVGEEYIPDFLLYWLNKTHNFSYVNLYGLSEPTNDVMQFLAKVGLMNQYVVKTKETDSAGKPKYRIDFTRAAASAIGDFRKGAFGLVQMDDDLLR